ncbi:MAG TPA: hypothetical protein VF161_07855, partial [Steroidobacteraceae bacterium]
MFSRDRRPLSGEDTLASAALELMGQLDDAFQYPISEQKTMRGIARDVMGNDAQVDELTHKRAKTLNPDATRAWEISTEIGGRSHAVTVVELRGGDMYLNISDFHEGAGGSAIYHIVANYAFNNGKTFTEDPYGLSDAAVLRRAQNMLSSAIKFGTTRHIAPGERQMEGSERVSAPPLRWEAGNDPYNVNALIETVFASVVRNVPEMANIEYNFETRRFEDSHGNPVSEQRFVELASTRGARSARAGRNTLKRVALLNTLVSSEDREGRRRVLGSILRQQSQGLDPSLREIFYSQEARPRAGLSASRVREILKTPLKRLEGTISVEVVDRVDQLPFDAPSDVRGAYYQGQVWLVAENLTEQEALRTLTHEVVGHLGLEALLGPREFKALLNEVNLMKRAGNKAIQQAAQHVFETHGKLDPDTEAREILAYLAESGIQNSLIRRIVAAIRRFLARMGLADLGTAEIESLIARAARFVEGRGADQPAVAVPAFQRAYHGSPHDFEQFSLHAIGTGEGAQAYGWGLYFAGKKEIADFYRKELARREWFYDGEPVQGYLGHTLEGVRASRNEEIPAAIAEEIKRLREHAKFVRNTYMDGDAAASMYEFRAEQLEALDPAKLSVRQGRLYEVEIPDDDDYLQWDEPISQQSDKVRAILERDRSLWPARHYLAAGTFETREAAENVAQRLGLNTYEISPFMGQWRVLAPVTEPVAPGSSISGMSNDPDGQEFYKWLGAEYGAGQPLHKKAEIASRKLAAAGIPGIRYPDAASRSDREWEVVKPDGQVVRSVSISQEAANEALLEARERYGEGVFLREKPRTFDYVVFDDKLIQVIAKYSRSEPMFYSAMQRVLTERLPAAGPAEKLREQIQNMVNSGLFKREEWEWSGVDEWLAEQKGKVTKDDVLEFLRANEIRVEEHLLGGEDSEYAGAKDTRFGKFTLPGGKDYRELLLTLPLPKRYQTRQEIFARYAPRIQALHERIMNPNLSQAERDAALAERERLEEQRDREAAAAAGEAGHDIFRSSHFGEPNIIAHVRFNERYDADGKRVLFLEEIQSDWAQKGRREGFAPPRDQYYLRTPDGDIGRDFASREEGEQYLRENPGAGTLDRARMEGVPPAPFVTKTDSWASLAMKRMIRWAAENGFERIAWTTGEQQAARYDLSRHVDEIVYYPNAEGTSGDLQAFKDGQEVIFQYDVPRERLPDYIGKEATDRLLNNPTERTPGLNGDNLTLKGVDLKIGGEGMRGFYDQILPSIVNKYVKKWGAKVGKATLPRAVTVGDRLEGVPADAESVSFEAHAFDVTPQMRDAAMRGQPLFARAAPGRTMAPPDSVVQVLREGRPVEFIFRGLFELVQIPKATKWFVERIEHGLTQAKFKNVAEDGFLGRINQMLETARAGLLDRYGLTEEYIRLDRKREANLRRVALKGVEIVENMKKSGINAQEAEVLQAVLTGEQIPDEKWSRLAEPIRKAIDELGAEAVELGLLDPETYERNRATYLHRVYKRHEAEQQVGIPGFVARIMSSRRKKIIGNALKHRGMKLEIALERLPEVEIGSKVHVYDRMGANGKVARRAFTAGPSEQHKDWVDRGEWKVIAVRGEKAVLWRDFTKEERMKMGEILDSRYTIAKTFQVMAHDLATGRFLKEIADNPDWTWHEEGEPPNAGIPGRRLATYTQYEWIRVPDTPIPGTNGKKRWGALAGKYVRAEIWRDLNELDQMQRVGLWSALMTQWKLNKALALDTPIPTPSGWTTMGEIRVGDQVFDERGNVCTVLEVKDIQHGRPCFEVVFSDGTKIIADDEHWWYTEHRNRGPGVRTTREIRETLTINHRGEAAHSISVAGPLDLPEADLPLPPYAFGLWLGDGHSSAPRITVGAQNFEEIRRSLEGAGVYCGKPGRDKRSTAVTFTVDLRPIGPGRDANLFKEGLESLGVLGSKRIPTLYLRASIEQRRALLAGLMDADGWITSRGTCGFATSLESLRDDVL